MWYVIQEIVFIVLLISVAFASKEKEDYLWVKVSAIYWLNTVNLNISGISIPILLLIYWIMSKNKVRVNKRLKDQAIAFSLVAFIGFTYLTAPIGIDHVTGKKDLYRDLARFEQVVSYKHYSPNYVFEGTGYEYGNDEVETRFIEVVLKERDIPIKDLDWLRYKSNEDVGFTWQAHSRKSHKEKTGANSTTNFNDEYEVYIRFENTPENTSDEYIGIYKKDERGMFYLDYMIQGKMKEK